MNLFQVLKNVLNFFVIQSRYGTFVNGEMVNDGEIFDGDEISLLDRRSIPQLQQHGTMYDSLSFIVRRINTEPVYRRLDDSRGEVLVSTSTISLISSDEEEDEKDKFAEDYEIGEPSTKNVDDSVPKAEPPTPQDPVSKVNVRNRLFFAQNQNKVATANMHVFYSMS